MNNSKYLIGVDIGGTDTKIGIIDSKGNIIAKTKIETLTNHHVQSLVRRVYSSCNELAENASIQWEDLIYVGIGLPGILDHLHGNIVFSPNIRDWKGVPITRIFQEEMKKICLLENDANAAAWGEKWAGAGKDNKLDSLVMITLGTGIGGGIILEDKIWHGCRNGAGEFGHIVIETNGRECGCGNYGCAEAYASATAVVMRYKETADLTGDITAEDIYKEAVNGNIIAKEVMEETGRYIAILIVNIMHTLNPNVIVIGGGMAAAEELLAKPISDEVNNRIARFETNCTNIVFGRLGNDAGMIGAAGWALKTLEISV